MGFIADIFTSAQANNAQKKSADKSIAASTAASDKSLALQKEMFDKLWGGTQVQRDAGDAATRMMASLMGLSIPAGQSPANPAASQPYGAQGGGSASYGGQRPLSALKSGIADTADGGQAEYGTGNALMGTGQYGRAAMIGEGASPQATTGSAAPTNALSGAVNPTDWLRSTPGYEFNLQEGMRGLNLAAGNRGQLDSGGAAREAIKFGQNYGDRIYGDQWNRLAGIAGAGQTAQSQGANAGQNYVNGSTNALQWNANNLSSSYQNKADSSSGFWGNLQGTIGSNALSNQFGSFMKGFA